MVAVPRISKDGFLLEIKEVYDNTKQIALEGLLHKYSQDFFDKGLKYIEAMDKKTRVFEISIISLSGKARKQ